MSDPIRMPGTLQADPWKPGEVQARTQLAYSVRPVVWALQTSAAALEERHVPVQFSQRHATRASPDELKLTGCSLHIADGHLLVQPVGRSGEGFSSVQITGRPTSRLPLESVLVQLVDAEGPGLLQLEVRHGVLSLKPGRSSWPLRTPSQGAADVFNADAAQEVADELLHRVLGIRIEPRPAGTTRGS